MLEALSVLTSGRKYSSFILTEMPDIVIEKDIIEDTSLEVFFFDVLHIFHLKSEHVSVNY